MQATPSHVSVAIIGGGPAGLIAAETARAAGLEVDVFEAKGSVGRKFLIAGKGGMNLTHGEPKPAFVQRYGKRAAEVGAWLEAFDADALRAWARELGVETFVGSSGRVFPSDLKAAPLLRGWVRRLRDSGVRFHVHHRWLGWHEDGSLRLDTPEGERAIRADATVLALGGASWPELGSDGAWQPWLSQRGVDVTPLVPANCGFDIGWSEHLSSRFAGSPLKPVAIHLHDAAGGEHARQGECVITAAGIEGSLIYAFSGELRDAIAAHGSTTIHLDLAPDRSLQRLRTDLAKPRGSRSMSEHLRRQTGLAGVKAGLLHEVLDHTQFHDADTLARTIKQLPLTLRRARPIQEAISSGGGVRLEALDQQLMLGALPGVFCAGEMLDWEAPTGGYLLTACFASGRRAGHGAVQWIKGLQHQATV
ncbi:TIGR03862 family flavoprotein [Dyella sp. ASV21]|uniref:TIGR03862 family flavoprotein n=1 Tax=Dyella sp. ASV21 TaxID=2795114 RepID=UPI0018EB8F7D|nr:TIGR03862 family flavoprotein [Dyella sp. ASV21]